MTPLGLISPPPPPKFSPPPNLIFCSGPPPPPPKKNFVGHKHWGGGNIFLICHVTPGVHMSKNLCEFFGRKLLTMSHNPAFLGGHWSNTSRHIRYLMRHVTPQNHVIERPSNFMRGSSSMLCHHPAKFSGHRYCDAAF